MQRQDSCLFRRLAVEVLLFPGFWLLLASPGWCQGTIDLRGKVRTDNGQTIPFGVTVRLESTDGRLVAEQPANSNGDFDFPNILKIDYIVFVRAEGFQPFEREVNLAERANVYFLDVSLSVANKTKLNSAALPSLTDASAPKKARKELEKGAQALERRNLPAAQAHLEKAVGIYPCYARAQVLLASILGEQRNASGAEAALGKAIECDSGFLDAYVELGQLLNAEKKFKESERVLSEGIRHSPNTWQFHYQLAASYSGREQYGKAEEAYLKVQSLDPTPPPELHVKLADVYLKTKAYDKAYVQMQEYLRIEPTGRFAEKVKAIMQQMESTGALRPAQAKASEPPK
jgi:tetratricopeptide (TPR) repeat protein